MFKESLCKAKNLADKVSVSTVRRVLTANNLNARFAAVKPKLNNNQIRRRLSFAKFHQNWAPLDWQKIIFSDECRIELNPKTKSYVRRPKHMRFHPKYIIESSKFSLSIMLW